MKQGDIIRQMSDDELIQFLKSVETKTISLEEACACCIYNYNHEFCMMSCNEGRIRWIESEVK